jgi:hypothetical protein
LYAQDVFADLNQLLADLNLVSVQHSNYLKMKAIKIFSVLTLIGILFACDEQPIIIGDIVIPVTDRIVLVEELTGVNCPNCPSGSAKLEALIQLFEGKVIGVGIHGDFLTQPIEGSAYDFRTDASIAIEDLFSFFGKPSAVINRLKDGNDEPVAILNPDQWAAAIQEELEKPSDMVITVEADYDASSRLLDVTVNSRAVRDIDETIYLTTLLSESHIIDAQKDQDQIIAEYEHNHVLRAVLGDNMTGDQIANSAEAGDLFTNTYSFTLPPEDGTWVAANIDVVAHMRTDDRVLQAGECHGCLE